MAEAENTLTAAAPGARGVRADMSKASEHAFTHTGTVHPARLSQATTFAQAGREASMHKTRTEQGEATRPKAAKPPTLVLTHKSSLKEESERTLLLKSGRKPYAHPHKDLSLEIRNSTRIQAQALRKFESQDWQSSEPAGRIRGLTH